MDGTDILKLGYAPGRPVGAALQAASRAAEAGNTDEAIRDTLSDVLAHPAKYVEDPIYGRLANLLRAQIEPKSSGYDLAHQRSLPYLGRRRH